MKRKIYSFLALLLLITGGASAQTLVTSTPDASKKYTIQTIGRGYLVCNNVHPDEVRGDVNSTAESAARFVFVPYTTEDDVRHTFLYNVDQQKFAIHTAGEYPDAVTIMNNMTRLSATVADFERLADVTVNVNTNSSTFPAYITSREGFYLNLGGTGEVFLNTWKTLDDGNQLAIAEDGEFSAADLATVTALLDSYFKTSKYTVTYNISFNGSTVTQEVTDVLSGSALPAAPVPNYITFTPAAGMPETVTENLTVTGTAVLNTTDKFGISASVDATDVVKFGMKNRDDSKWVFAKDGVTNEVGDAATAPTLETYENYQWIVTGDWVNGYTLYNVGQQKYLTNDGQSGLSDTLGKFLLVKETNGWAFLQENHSNVLGDHKGQNGTLGTWGGSNSTADPGSVHVIYSEADIEEAILQGYQERVQAVLDVPRNVVFGLTDAVAAPLNTKKTELQGSTDAAAWAALAEECEAATTIPLTEGYYRIENANNAGQYMAFTDKLTIAANSENDASTFVKVTDLGGGTYSLGMQGQFIQPAHQSAQVLLGKESAAYKISEKEAAKAVFTVSGNTYEYLHYNGGILGWETSAAASLWYMYKVENIELDLTTVGNATYATTYLPFPVKLDENSSVKAYVVTGTTTTEGDTYATTQLLGKEIPAGTPVVLIGENETSVTATLLNEASAEALAKVPADQLLQGQYMKSIKDNSAATSPTVTAGDDYVLAASSGAIGFFKLATGGTLAANRAFIPSGKVNGTGIRGILLGDGTVTGIDRIDFGAAQNAAVYDLSGRRVQQAGKGIFIVNGKKVLK